MRETFECMDCDKAIEKLQRLKKENKKRKVIVCTIQMKSQQRLPHRKKVVCLSGNPRRLL